MSRDKPRMILRQIQGPRLHPYQEIKEEEIVDADDQKVLLPIHQVLLIHQVLRIRVPVHQIQVPALLIHRVRVVVPHPLLPILV